MYRTIITLGENNCIEKIDNAVLDKVLAVVNSIIQKDPTQLL
jgi:hypothetical protein